ncbi:MAG: DNA-3-methyladenine glycosylase I [Proteobacteria bacterium]|nr:DNA-3-methyladenine glycosylase I [Pseudomonadota bacterium]
MAQGIQLVSSGQEGARQAFGGDNRHLGARVFQNVHVIAGSVSGVKRNCNGPQRHNGDIGDHPFGPVFTQQRDPVPLLDPKAFQPFGQPGNFIRAFNPAKVAAFTDEDKQRLLADAGIIRNRAKVNSAVTNAQAYLRIQQEFGSFDTYIWRFTDGQVIRHSGMDNWEQLPVTSPEADALSADLRSRGFKFVGPTICYAYMQSIGLVDDHLTGCFLYHI